MAQKTALSTTGVPGQVHSFVAKDEAEQNIVPGLQFSFQPDRFDFSAPPNPQDFTAGDD